MRLSRWALLLVLLAVLAALLLAPRWQQRRDGAALFEGARPLQARVAGHDERLPPEAARCINCHGASGFAPRLSAQALQQPQARRGGPPSRYDAASLCRLLRTGVDPAWVMVPRAMPRYDIANSDCEALWRHLTDS